MHSEATNDTEGSKDPQDIETPQPHRNQTFKNLKPYTPHRTRRIQRIHRFEKLEQIERARQIYRIQNIRGRNVKWKSSKNSGESNDPKGAERPRPQRTQREKGFRKTQRSSMIKNKKHFTHRCWPGTQDGPRHCQSNSGSNSGHGRKVDPAWPKFSISNRNFI